MLRNLKGLYNYVLQAEEGDVGRCKDFLFDDEHWTVRYMVADTGKWLPERKVLLSPISLGTPDWESRRFPVRLTQKQIENAPALEAHAPISREYEKRWMDHYGWTYYWFGGGVWGTSDSPTGLYTKTDREKVEPADGRLEDSSLRSTREVTGYDIRATDGEIGHVEDFILDDTTWTLRYMVVDTLNWLPGRKVLVSPVWITSVDWADSVVAVDLTREEVKDSPTYDPAIPVNREYEERLYDFYGRPKYW